MKHLLLTRSDYPIGHPEIPYRVSLFERITVPSVLNQTSKDFTWLVKTRNPEFQRVAERNGIRWVEDFELEGTTLTTRLDNDDALLPRFIETVQHHARASIEPLLIDLPGYRVDTRTGSIIKMDRYIKTPSPFVSLLANDPRGVYQDQHTRIHRRFPRVVLQDRSWVQVIHGRNQQMEWEDGAPVSPEERRRIVESIPLSVVGIR